MDNKKKNDSDIIRSSAAEYLTFIAAHGDGGVEAIYADENIWLTQKMTGALYKIETHTVNYHLKKIFADSELQENSVVRNFRITASDGKNYTTKHYNLSAIIAVGYKVNSERAVQFRKWATGIIQEFTIKGFTMDDERLENDGTILGKKYFEEQLQRIREIRLSERKFYHDRKGLYYIVKVFSDNQKDNFERMLIKPKVYGRIMTNNNYPIVALLTITNNQSFDYKKFNPMDVNFVEWVFIKPLED